MSIFKKSAQKKDPMDQPPPKKRSHTGFLASPYAKKSGASVPWWASKPEFVPDTFHLEASEAELAEKITRLIHTDRIAIAKLSTAMETLFQYLNNKQLTIDAVIPLLLQDPALAKHVCLYFEAPPDGKTLAVPVPKNIDEWHAFFKEFAEGEGLCGVFAGAARRIYLSGPTASSNEARVLWEHVLATALATRHVANTFHFKYPHLAFVTALMHDIGRAAVRWTVMAATTPETIPGPTFLRHLANLLHEEAGANVARRWKLPDPVVQVIAHHHGEIDPEDRLKGLRAMVRLADQASLRTGHGELERPSNRPLIECSSAKILGINEENAPKILEPLPALMIEATM